MTKKEREIIGKQISTIIKDTKMEWEELKEQISDHGYQPYYASQEYFKIPISNLIKELTDNDKQLLICEWKSKKERIQFNSDEKYLKQYEAYIMEEIVSRAQRATYWM